MQIFLHTNPFQAHLPQYYPASETTLSTPTNYTPELLTAAMRVLEKIWRPGYKWKKIGVMLMEIGPESAVQSAFDTLPPVEIEKRRRAMAACRRDQQVVWPGDRACGHGCGPRAPDMGNASGEQKPALYHAMGGSPRCCGVAYRCRNRE